MDDYLKMKIEEIGKELSIECPENDCIIFRNTYKMYKGICQDISGCLLSLHGESVLRQEARRLYGELVEMYYTNNAIKNYKGRN